MRADAARTERHGDFATVSIGRFGFEAEDEHGLAVVTVYERRGGHPCDRGQLRLSREAWRELREILLAPIRRPVAGASPERLAAPIIEHLRRKR